MVSSLQLLAESSSLVEIIGFLAFIAVSVFLERKFSNTRKQKEEETYEEPDDDERRDARTKKVWDIVQKNRTGLPTKTNGPSYGPDRPVPTYIPETKVSRIPHPDPVPLQPAPVDMPMIEDEATLGSPLDHAVSASQLNAEQEALNRLLQSMSNPELEASARFSRSSTIEQEARDRLIYGRPQSSARSVPNEAEPSFDVIRTSLASPLALRTAILYQEILGKPAALRD